MFLKDTCEYMGGAGDSDILWRYNIGKKRLEE